MSPPPRGLELRRDQLVSRASSSSSSRRRELLELLLDLEDRRVWAPAPSGPEIGKRRTSTPRSLQRRTRRPLSGLFRALSRAPESASQSQPTELSKGMHLRRAQPSPPPLRRTPHQRSLTQRIAASAPTPALPHAAH
eukprot:scaffold129188_cov66-Phaeocystis_antarctica.AAC.2